MARGTRGRQACGVTAAVLVAAAAWSPGAWAADVSHVNGTTSYSSRAGEKDSFVATLGSSNWQFAVQFGGASILGGWSPCSRDGNGYNAFCPVGSPGALVVQLNDNDDAASVVADGRVVTLSGGSGNDNLTGTNVRLNASGGPGDDSLAGAGTNADVLAGDDGDDFFTNVAGPDTVDGGPGVDTVSFAGQTGAMAVTLDDQANDGPAGTGAVANVGSSVENLIGGPAGDTLLGSQAANHLEGGGGNDTLRGNGGPDVLSGESGEDTIEARDGIADAIDCGSGSDTARVDAADTVTGCERVFLPDDDGDGTNPPADCNDADASLHPGAVDRPGDGIDQDCDGADAVIAGAGGLVDRDGDGTAPPADCDDTNAAVHAGARDRPGNGIDEDCSGADSRFPHVSSPIANAWAAGVRLTRLVRLEVSSVPRGGRVEVRCRPGCPFRTRTVQPRRGRAQLVRLFPRRELRTGVVLEIRVLAPDHIGKVVRYTMRPGKLPGVRKLCLPPGARAPRRC
jgi:Ca2+-binding RTX toxin-like protein